MGRRDLRGGNIGRAFSGEAGANTKHRFARTDGQALWLAGLWDRCTTPDAGEVTSFTILTGPSEGWLGGHQTRAPVILEPQEWDTSTRRRKRGR